MEITGSSCTFSLTGLTLGTSISRPNSITCAVSMKMMSKTRTTSTNGTILISALPILPRNRPRLIPPEEVPSEKAMLLHASFGEVQELEHEVFHARAKFLNGVPKEIVKDRGRDCRRQAHGGSNESLRDSRGDCAQAGRTGGSELLERIDDAPDSSEQTDERRHGGGGREQAHIALEPGNFLAHSQLQTALERQRIGDRAARLHLAGDLTVAEIEDADQRRSTKLFARHRDGLQSGRFSKGSQKSAIGRARAPEYGPLGKNDRPGKHREDQEQHHYGLGQGARTLNEIPKLQLQEQPAEMGKYQPGSFRFNDSVPPVFNTLKNRTRALCFTV